MNRSERLDEHQKFKELAALAQRGTLSDAERLALERHLRICESCQQVYDEYTLIGSEGMPLLAAAYGYNQESEDWDDRPGRNKLLASIQQENQPGPAETRSNRLRVDGAFRPANTASWWAGAAVAACAFLAVALGAYRLGRTHLSEQQPAPATWMHPRQLASDKKASDEFIALQAAQVSRLQTQVFSGQQEITRLREELRAEDAHAAALSASNSAQSEQFRQVSEQRDKLAEQLRDAEQSYQVVQAELTGLHAEHDRVLLRTTSLESKVDDLTASTRDQERRLKDNEQYLTSDRDIRELMGARKLYIADVFDVDSGSRTRKPFGRVFYTQSKSLIFYAFDLDRQPGVKNASAFQVWGKRDTESGEKYRAMNLGILYMDSESNRRWVLRLDDPKQLAEIDAVFVTFEPYGGSQKPTGKPFLYALLRKEANHP